jgi:phosphoribosyl-AMP cyclohydrolase
LQDATQALCPLAVDGCADYAEVSFTYRMDEAETREMSETIANGPDFSRGDGLLPAIAQDAESGEVLMLAYMNSESYAETLATGQAVYYSRSRKKLWRKGEESGNVQRVRAVFVDCDRDTILLSVEQVGGAACHEGYKSCFFRQVTPEGLKVVAKRVFDPATVYAKK